MLSIEEYSAPKNKAEQELASIARNIDKYINLDEPFFFYMHYLQSQGRAVELSHPHFIALHLTDAFVIYDRIDPYKQLLMLKNIHLYLELSIALGNKAPILQERFIKKISEIIEANKALLGSETSMVAKLTANKIVEKSTYDIAIGFEAECIQSCLSLFETDASDVTKTIKAFAAFRSKEYGKFLEETKGLLSRFPKTAYITVMHIRFLADIVIKLSNLDQAREALTASDEVSLSMVPRAQDYIKELFALIKGAKANKSLLIMQAASQALGEIAKQAATAEIRLLALQGEETLEPKDKISLEQLANFNEYRGGNAPVRYFAAIAFSELRFHDDPMVNNFALSMQEKIFSKETGRGKEGKEKAYVKNLFLNNKEGGWPASEWKMWLSYQSNLPIPVTSELIDYHSRWMLASLHEVHDTVYASHAGTALRLEHNHKELTEKLSSIEGSIANRATSDGLTAAALTPLHEAITRSSDEHALAIEKLQSYMADRFAAIEASLAEQKSMKEAAPIPGPDIVIHSDTGNLAERVAPTPSPYEFARICASLNEPLSLSRVAILPPTQAALKKEAGWELADIIEQETCRIALYIHKDNKQLLIAYHCDNKSLGAVIESTSTLSHDHPVRTAIEILLHKKVLDLRSQSYRVFATGEGLAGLFAQITVFWSQRYDLGQSYNSDMSAVVFNSPGAVPLMEKLLPNIESERNSIDIAKLNIINYCTAPNLINTFGKHTGSVYYIAESDTLTFSVSADSNIELILNHFAPSAAAKTTKLLRFSAWPESNYDQLRQLMTVSGAVKETALLPFSVLDLLYQRSKEAMGFRAAPTRFDTFIGDRPLHAFRALLARDGSHPDFEDAVIEKDYAIEGVHPISPAMSRSEMTLAHFAAPVQRFLIAFYDNVIAKDITAPVLHEMAHLFGISPDQKALLESFKIKSYGDKQFIALPHDEAYPLDIFAFRAEVEALLFHNPKLAEADVTLIAKTALERKVDALVSQVRRLDTLVKSNETKLASSLHALTSELTALSDKADADEKNLNNVKIEIATLREIIDSFDPTLVPPTFDAMKAELTDYYEKVCKNLDRALFTASAQARPIEKFVNLQIISASDQLKKEISLATYKPAAAGAGAVDEESPSTHIASREEYLPSYEEIYAVKAPLAYQDMMGRTMNEKGGHHVMVLGRPGVGKTTLLNRICFDWAASEEGKTPLFTGIDKTNFDLVILLPLRHWYNRGDKTLAQYLKEKYFPSLRESAIMQFLHANTDRILWLVDGYDEVKKHSHAALLNSLNTLFRKAKHVITTSRPYYELSHEADTKLEIVGFDKAQVEEYIKGYFNKPSAGVGDASASPIADKLIAYINTHPELATLASTPIMLELICASQLTRAGEAVELNFTTMTELYCKITENLKAHFLGESKTEAEITECMSLLEELAYHSFKKEQLLFVPKKVMPGRLIPNEVFKNAHNLGVLKLTGENIKAELAQGDYYFVHLTFQEFFAASFMANVIAKGNVPGNTYYRSVMETIAHNKYEPRFELMLCFIAGILANREDALALERFFRIILSEPRDMVGVREFTLMMKLMKEIERYRGFKTKADWLNSYENYFAHLNDLDLITFAYSNNHFDNELIDLIYVKKIDKFENEKFHTDNSNLTSLYSVTVSKEEREKRLSKINEINQLKLRILSGDKEALYTWNELIDNMEASDFVTNHDLYKSSIDIFRLTKKDIALKGVIKYLLKDLYDKRRFPEGIDWVNLNALIGNKEQSKLIRAAALILVQTNNRVYDDNFSLKQSDPLWALFETYRILANKARYWRSHVLLSVGPFMFQSGIRQLWKANKGKEYDFSFAVEQMYVGVLKKLLEEYVTGDFYYCEKEFLIALIHFINLSPNNAILFLDNIVFSDAKGEIFSLDSHRAENYGCILDNLIAKTLAILAKSNPKLVYKYLDKYHLRPTFVLNFLSMIDFRGNEKVYSELIKLYEECNDENKKDIIPALANIATFGDTLSVRILLAELNAAFKDVFLLKNVIHAISILSFKDDPVVIASLFELLQKPLQLYNDGKITNDSYYVKLIQVAIASALAKVLTTRNVDVTDSIISILSLEDNIDDYKDIIKALAIVSPIGYEKAIAAIEKMDTKKLSNEFIRNKQLAFGILSGKQKPVALEELKLSLYSDLALASKITAKEIVHLIESPIPPQAPQDNKKNKPIKDSYIITPFEFKKQLSFHLSKAESHIFYKDVLLPILKQAGVMYRFNSLLYCHIGKEKHVIELSEAEWAMLQKHLDWAAKEKGLKPIELPDSVWTDASPSSLLTITTYCDVEKESADFAELVSDIIDSKNHPLTRQLEPYRESTFKQSVKLNITEDKIELFELPLGWHRILSRHKDELEQIVKHAVKAYGIGYWDNDKKAACKAAIIKSLLKNLKAIEEEEVSSESCSIVNGGSKVLFETVTQAIASYLRNPKYDIALIKLISTGESETNLDKLSHLLALGASANASYDDFYLERISALQRACKNLLPNTVEALLKAGANVEHRDSKGRTAIMVTLARLITNKSLAGDDPRLLAIIELLYLYGADFNATSDYWYDSAGKIVLTVASAGFSQLSSPLTGNFKGWSVLHVAAYYRDSKYLIERLLQYSADPTLRTSEFASAAYARKMPHELAALNGNHTVSNMLAEIINPKPTGTTRTTSSPHAGISTAMAIGSLEGAGAMAHPIVAMKY